MTTDATTPTGNTYDKYGSTNPIERRMMSGFLSTLDALVTPTGARRILEVGMGEGIVSARVRELLPDASFAGLDLPDPELAAHWQDFDVSCLFGDVTALPFADDTFDLVLAIEVFEHFPDPQAALAEVARVCSATLVASVPLEPIWRVGNLARRRYLREWGNTPGHVNHWGRRSFATFVAGEFDVEEVHSPLPWTMVRARSR